MSSQTPPMRKDLTFAGAYYLFGIPAMVVLGLSIIAAEEAKRLITGDPTATISFK